MIVAKGPYVCVDTFIHPIQQGTNDRPCQPLAIAIAARLPLIVELIGVQIE